MEFLSLVWFCGKPEQPGRARPSVDIYPAVGERCADTANAFVSLALLSRHTSAVLEKGLEMEGGVSEVL